MVTHAKLTYAGFPRLTCSITIEKQRRFVHTSTQGITWKTQNRHLENTESTNLTSYTKGSKVKGYKKVIKKRTNILQTTASPIQWLLHQVELAWVYSKEVGMKFQTLLAVV
ncbi:hypothetical protein Zmor_014227 [Zophobas morio]|uniref:Uncharacterized protein n=1 Tax=Zophobas morio TaxID=2755281 RepID=A0AA38MFI3_9CUCU|nr:hypothetical protein Zmor_014227 [Zophobas morio]